MRRLTFAQRGMTLVELVISLAIAGILVAMAAPYFADYNVNARLREGGNAALSEALYAQGEAIKRNGTVRLVISGSTLQTTDETPERADPPDNVLRNRAMPDGVTADAAVTLNFGSNGRPTPFGTSYVVDLSKSGVTCSGDYRCPSLRVDAGGGIRLCGNKNACS